MLFLFIYKFNLYIFLIHNFFNTFFFTLKQDAIESQSFFQPVRTIKKGDVAQGFKESDHVLQGAVKFHWYTHPTFTQVNIL